MKYEFIVRKTFKCSLREELSKGLAIKDIVGYRYCTNQRGLLRQRTPVDNIRLNDNSFDVDLLLYSI
jgi:hypothetical protein